MGGFRNIKKTIDDETIIHDGDGSVTVDGDVGISGPVAVGGTVTVDGTVDVNEVASVAGVVEVDGQVIIADLYLALKQLLNYIQRAPWLDPTTKKVNVATVTTVSTVTSVTTVATITNVGAGLNALAHIAFPTIRNNWVQSVRNNIT